MQNYRSISCRAYLPVGCANKTVKRVQVRCQSSNSGRDYSTLDKSQLKKELQTRGLSISGGRDQLIHRLHVAENPLPPIENAIPQQPANTTATEEFKTTVAQIHQEDPVPVKKPRAVRKMKTSNDTLLPINSDQPDQLPESDQLNEISLLKLAKGELQAMAAARGVAKSGTKAQIVARILEVETGETVAATGQLTAAPIAERKKRVVKKKATAASSTNEPKNSTTTTTAINNEEPASSATTSTTPSKKIFEPAAPLRLNESAALKMNDALTAAATVVAALNSKRRVLEMMQETVAVAVTVTAAQNLKWKELEIEKESMKNEEKNSLSSSVKAATATSTSSFPPASPSERRRLSPDEAAKVLEEVVRRKGTGGVGLGAGAGGNNKNSNNSGGGNGDGASVGAAASEVDSMKTVMAGLKARLHAQEENTEQLRVALTQEQTTSTSVAPAAPSAVAVEAEKKKESNATTAPSTPPAAPVSDDMRSAIDFALTLGKAVTVVGRGFFNSLRHVNKKK